jgi:carbamoyltransferase
MKYHPRISYTYMPSAKLRVPWGNGGYLVRTNAAGFRSDREFAQERKPGTFRALIFGDSQTAGDGVINAQRYTDLLEKSLPDFELNNYALSGTGPDQQFLAYQENSAIEHDLLIIALYVENIRRVNARVVKSRDASGEEYFRAKPYYQIENNELVLHNVPVPKQPWTEQTLPAEFLPYCYPPHVAQQNAVAKTVSHKVTKMLRAAVPLDGLRRAVKTAAMRFEKFRPVPDFDEADNPGWLLLRRILEAWIAASRTPVLLVPIPHYYFLASSSDTSGYQARFRELADASKCHLYDPLPDLLKLSEEERKALWSDSSGHISIRGHQILANLFVSVVQGFMPAAQRQQASQVGPA